MGSGCPVDVFGKESVGGEAGTSGKSKSKRNRSRCNGNAFELESEACSVRETLNELKIIQRNERKDHVKSRLQSNLEQLQEQLREIVWLSRSRTQTSTGAATVASTIGHHNLLKEDESKVIDANVDFGLLPEEKNNGLLVRSRMAIIRMNSGHLSYPPGIKWPQICSQVNGTIVDPRKVVFKTCGQIKQVELKLVRPVPRYTTWTQVDRNECMTEDQSISRRQRISYEPNGQETFYGSYHDLQDEDTKREDIPLSRSDEIILQKSVSKHGASAAVLQIIADFLDTTVQTLERKCLGTEVRGNRNSVSSSKRQFLGKGVHDPAVVTRTVSIWKPAFAEPISLKEATAFCNIKFCRRCYIFNCKLHVDHQEMVDSAREGLLALPPVFEHRKQVLENSLRSPCSLRCLYSRVNPSFGTPIVNYLSATTAIGSSTKSGVVDHEAEAPASASMRMNDMDNESGGILETWLSKYSFDLLSDTVGRDGGSKDKTWQIHPISQVTHAKQLHENSGTSAELVVADDAESSSELEPLDCSVRMSAGDSRNPKVECALPLPLMEIRWSRFEKELCHKGLEIYGRDSCLIGSLFKGSKSCADIADYLNKLSIEGLDGKRGYGTTTKESSISELTSSNGGAFVKKRVSVKLKRKKVKISLKSSTCGTATNRRRTGWDGFVIQNSCLQFNPCSCVSTLGCTKDCPCVTSKQFCEKYCGCSKTCKNLFRGCHCAKSMCDGRRCACVCLGRECDPDLCKSCSVEYGKLESHECRNMNILLQNKKRTLLGESEVCKGWGLFAGEEVCKNDFIGEYTGELISHEEANKRGRIYDRETSFLFNLNDKFVIDAFRRGSPLKFANHSSLKPNCYTKVLLVAGDHRVGIFAKEKIEAGEELLYNYQYEPDIAPRWAIADGNKE